MSIATELTRLKQAKSDIKTSIENKGVTVPTAATFDVYNTYIDLISTGGTASFQRKDFTITANGVTDITVNEGFDGITAGTITVDVKDRLNPFLNNQLKEITAEDTQGIAQTRKYLFALCSNIKKITFADTINRIGDYCCSSAISLTDVTLPSNLESVGSYAFANTPISAMTLPATLTGLTGSYNFSNMPNLQTVTIGGSISALTQGCFYNDTALTTVNITHPETIGRVLNTTFSKCSKLEFVPLAETSITAITNGLTSCSSLTKTSSSVWAEDDYIVLPKTLKSVSSNAFSYLRESGGTPVNVMFPKGFTSIGSSSFANTFNTSIYLFGTVSLTANAIRKDKSNKIYIPIDLQKTYQNNSTWSGYTNYMAINPYAAPSGNDIYAVYNMSAAGNYKVIFSGSTLYNNITSMYVNDTIVTKSDTVALTAGTNIIKFVCNGTTIGLDYAFYNCGDLEECYVGDKIVATNTEEMFGGCNRIRNVVFGSGITELSNCTFDGTEAPESPWVLTLHSPTVVQLPTGIGVLSNDAWLDSALWLNVPLSLIDAYYTSGTGWCELYDVWGEMIAGRIIE